MREAEAGQDTVGREYERSRAQALESSRLWLPKPLFPGVVRSSQRWAPAPRLGVEKQVAAEIWGVRASTHSARLGGALVNASLPGERDLHQDETLGVSLTVASRARGFQSLLGETIGGCPRRFTAWSVLSASFFRLAHRCARVRPGAGLLTLHDVDEHECASDSVIYSVRGGSMATQWSELRRKPNLKEPNP